MRWQILVGLISRRGNCSIMAPACTDEHATYLLLDFTQTHRRKHQLLKKLMPRLSLLYKLTICNLPTVSLGAEQIGLLSSFLLDLLMMLQA